MGSFEQGSDFDGIKSERIPEDLSESLGGVVLGVSTVNEPDALSTAHERLAGERLTSAEIDAETARLDKYDRSLNPLEIPANDFERKVTLWTLRKSLKKTAC